MKVAEVVVKILESEGIDTAFGIPGASINPVYKHLGQSSKIRHYIARHEEGAAHAADGYTRASGKMACAIATSGPAATNFVTGLYTAQIDSIPIVAITGQNTRAQLGKESFQCVDIATIAEPVVKGAWCITEPAQVPGIMRGAFKLAREGRPGPVLLDLPLDVQMADISYDPDVDSPLAWEKPKPDPRKIEKAIDMILSAKSPILLLGGGVILAGATEEFVKFAEYMALPVVTTYMGKGGISPDHPLYCGQVGIQCNTRFGNKAFLDSDLVIGIGCRFSDRHTGGLDVYTKGRKFIHVDIESTQIGRIVPTELGIVSDAKLALEALLSAAKEKTKRREPQGWVSDIPRLRGEMERRLKFDNVPIKPQRVFYELNEFFGDDAIFTVGCGLVQIWSGQFQRASRPRHYLPSGGAGTLGYEIPAAVGAKIARPNNPVVAVVGDGGFSFMGEELAMACQYDIPVVIVIVNNGYLSLIRQNQKYAYDFEYGVDLWYKEKMIDFVKIAEGYGAKAERVEDPAEISRALRRAVDSGKPYVIDVIVERQTDCSMGVDIDKVREFE
ncbi:MAG: biosynthetic-type acetolactate synthase large subunit [Firmicutes bacterium]|nr:biosynthetic-type acetolactate synthase large subunit [Bacillota bacterium]